MSEERRTTLGSICFMARATKMQTSEIPSPTAERTSGSAAPTARASVGDAFGTRSARPASDAVRAIAIAATTAATSDS